MDYRINDNKPVSIEDWKLIMEFLLFKSDRTLDSILTVFKPSELMIDRELTPTGIELLISLYYLVFTNNDIMNKQPIKHNIIIDKAQTDCNFRIWNLIEFDIVNKQPIKPIDWYFNYLYMIDGIR